MKSRTPAPQDRGGGAGTAVLLGSTMVLLSLVGNWPFPFGPVVAIGGVVASVAWRWLDRERSGLGALLPAFVAVAALVALAPATTAAELLAAACGLALLLWIADDPARPSGGGRRAAPAVALAGLAVGLAWALTLVSPGSRTEVGIAGGLLALGVLLLALLLAWPRMLARAAA